MNIQYVNLGLFGFLLISLWKQQKSSMDLRFKVDLFERNLHDLHILKRKTSTQVAEIVKQHHKTLRDVIEYVPHQQLLRKIVIPGKEVNLIFTDDEEHLRKYGPSHVTIKTISLTDDVPKLIHRISVQDMDSFWIEPTENANYSQGYGVLAANEFICLLIKYGCRDRIFGRLGFCDTFRHRQLRFYRKLGFEVNEHSFHFNLELTKYKPIEDIDNIFMRKRIKWYEDMESSSEQTLVKKGVNYYATYSCFQRELVSFCEENYLSNSSPGQDRFLNLATQKKYQIDVPSDALLRELLDEIKNDKCITNDKITGVELGSGYCKSFLRFLRDNSTCVEYKIGNLAIPLLVSNFSFERGSFDQAKMPRYLCGDRPLSTLRAVIAIANGRKLSSDCWELTFFGNEKILTASNGEHRTLAHALTGKSYVSPQRIYFRETHFRNLDTEKLNKILIEAEAYLKLNDCHLKVSGEEEAQRLIAWFEATRPDVREFIWRSVPRFSLGRIGFTKEVSLAEINSFSELYHKVVKNKSWYARAPWVWKNFSIDHVLEQEKVEIILDYLLHQKFPNVLSEKHRDRLQKGYSPKCIDAHQRI